MLSVFKGTYFKALTQFLFYKEPVYLNFSSPIWDLGFTARQSMIYMSVAFCSLFLFKFYELKDKLNQNEVGLTQHIASSAIDNLNCSLSM